MVPLLVLLLLSSALAFDDLDYDDDDLRNTTTTTLTSTSTTISTSTTTNQPTERSAEPDLTDLRQSFSELEKENEKLEDNRKCLCDVILSRAFSILLDKLHDAENEVVRLVDEKKEEEEKKMNREEEKKKRNREELTVEEEKIFRIDDKDFDWFEALETTTTPLPTSTTTTTTSLPTSTSTTVTSTKSSGTTSATTTTVIGQVRIFNALPAQKKTRFDF
jgi:hypothetical protein